MIRQTVLNRARCILRQLRILEKPLSGTWRSDFWLERILNIGVIKWMQKYVRGIDWSLREWNQPVDE